MKMSYLLNLNTFGFENGKLRFFFRFKCFEKHTSTTYKLIILPPKKRSSKYISSEFTFRCSNVAVKLK